ncbi:MAG: response regulator, partial [Bacteroidetes bacterium]|nr:response regulator [Bacteroidota bacterium]
MSINILVYEDKNDFREALVQLISNTPEFSCVGAYRNCGHVINHLEKYKPTVILMDIDMPEMNGIEGV